MSLLPILVSNSFYDRVYSHLPNICLTDSIFFANVLTVSGPGALEFQIDQVILKNAYEQNGF